MSGKLTLGTDAGGSVTITVDDTETGDINYPLDSAGIENGGNSFSLYTMFPDGTLICNSNGVITTGADGFITLSFPIPFIDLPAVSGIGVSGDAQESIVSIDTGSIGLTPTNVRFATRVNGVLTQKQFGYTAIGRWK